MQRELCLKCKKCNKVIKFDNYAKKFICYECNCRMGLEEINNENIVIKVDNDFANEIKNPKVLSINYAKDYFLKELNRNFKYRIFAPDEFIKTNKYKSENIKLIYLPLLVYETECAYFNKQEFELYKISNMIIDEYVNFDKETLDYLYPIDITGNEEKTASLEFAKNFNIGFDKILESIHEKVQRNLINNINNGLINDNSNVIFIKENIECLLLPIYDFNIKYNAQEYHLSMNTNTGKVSVTVPIDNKKLIITTITFLAIDIMFFWIAHVIRMIGEFVFIIAIFLFIIELLSIISFYLYNETSESDINKRKRYYIKKIK